MIHPHISLSLSPSPFMTIKAISNGFSHPTTHIVLVPLMAQGHTIPMLDIAHLLAGRDVTVTFVTTPLNAARIKPAIDHTARINLPIRFLSLPFPCEEVGLPPGYENADTLPSRDLAANFFKACSLLLHPLLHHLQSTSPPPTAIVADTCHPWTRELANLLSIPRFAFNGFGCFALLCARNIRQHGLLDDDGIDPTEPFIIPGLPDSIYLTVAQAPGYFQPPSLVEFRKEYMAAEAAADAVVVNSFDALEPSYSEYYGRAIGKKVFTLGPTWLYNIDNVADMAARGDEASIDVNRCMSWLESKEPGSVLYVSFGSMARTAPKQLAELGLGLEASGSPFIWVVKAGEKKAEVEEWLSSNGLEERINGRGLIIRGWAPQVMILSHPAIGGFMTHCGWNSTLEGISAGVPMLTWPHFAEQFVNERLVVDVLKVGVAVGVKTPTRWGEEHTLAAIKRMDVELVVRRLMQEGEQEKKRARALGVAAREAMGKGGTSHAHLTQLLEYVSNWGEHVKDDKSS